MKRQRGLSFIAFILVAAVLAFVGFTAARCVPAWTEYFALKKVLKQTADEFSVDAAPTVIRNAFDRRTSIDDIPVRSTDLEIAKEGGKIRLSASYTRKVPIAGNASLHFAFEATAIGGR